MVKIGLRVLTRPMPDAITKEQKEVKWRQPVFETCKTARRRIIAEQHGLVVTIGHFPGLHIEAVPLRIPLWKMRSNPLWLVW
jgi:hypothetical protein